MKWNTIFRHASYLLLILAALTAIIYIVEYQNHINTTVNVIASTIDENNPSQQAINTIAELQAESYNAEPVKYYLYAILAIALSVPLTGIVLYALTKAPFLKIIIKGKDGEFDETERLMTYVVLAFVYIGNCCLLAKAISLMGAS